MRGWFRSPFSSQPGEPDETTQDDWTLTPEQTLYMLQHHNEIEVAFQDHDLDSLSAFAETSDYTAVFGDMRFDEAYDRYNTRQ